MRNVQRTVKHGRQWTDLGDADVVLALAVEEAGLVGVRVDVVEGRGDAALLIADALGEVRHEERRLVALSLAMLHGLAAEQVVELNGLVGDGALLVLSTANSKHTKRTLSNSSSKIVESPSEGTLEH